ncbi:hypothetical protein QQY24_01660 [Streptomyces sp. TG1A-8]|uniref:hypothetical protein n=1 Tax=Streptomyces sp. TG1A-8 TaxID=3051385 RepID=UPI00265BE228|nr:hypothetical protein [Streptomyces sp. TG1A-8]MDO0924185.1 hypothetical protein [Streptomyces sp. TG1A-8]
MTDRNGVVWAVTSAVWDRQSVVWPYVPVFTEGTRPMLYPDPEATAGPLTRG